MNLKEVSIHLCLYTVCNVTVCSWQCLILTYTHCFFLAMHNIALAKKEQNSCYYGEDSILVFKWNNAGLLVRAPTATAHGWVNDLGAPVVTAEDMKEAIVQRLTQAPNGGTDLGDHHDLFQFLPSFKKYQCVAPLIQGNLFLRHHGLGWTFATPAAQAAASTWPDIVDYVQEVTIVKSNAADVPFYFNC